MISASETATGGRETGEIPRDPQTQGEAKDRVILNKVKKQIILTKETREVQITSFPRDLQQPIASHVPHKCRRGVLFNSYSSAVPVMTSFVVINFCFVHEQKYDSRHNADPPSHIINFNFAEF